MDVCLKTVSVRVGDLILTLYPPQLLFSNGEPAVLRQQSLSVLCYLAINDSRPVSKQELLTQVWPDRCVTEDSIYQCVREIRDVLGDRQRQILRTISKTGYQLTTIDFQTQENDSDSNARFDSFEGRLAVPSINSFRQQVNYTRSSDNISIAYASSGSGSPIVRAPTWMTHLELDWEYEPIGTMVRSLSHRMHMVRFDARGTGLSERVNPGQIDQWFSDLEAVITASGMSKPALLGCSGGSTTAIRFASRYPERISCLILLGGFSRGSLHRGVTRKTVEAFSHLIREGWGQKNTAFIQLMTGSLFPGATPRQMEEFNELQKLSCDADTAARLLLNIADTNVQDDLTQIAVPTLVLHSENDLRVPLTEAYLIVETIADAQLITYSSENHVPLAQERAFDLVQNAIFSFVEEHTSLPEV